MTTPQLAQPPAGPNLDPIPPLHECEPAVLSWVSSNGPFKAWIYTGNGGVGTVLTELGNLATPQVKWIVDLARGSEVQLAVRDAAGQTVASPMLTVPGNCPAGAVLRDIKGEVKTVVATPKPTPVVPAPSSVPPPFSSPVSVEPPVAPTPTFSPVIPQSLSSAPAVPQASAAAVSSVSNTPGPAQPTNPPINQFSVSSINHSPSSSSSVSAGNPVPQPFGGGSSSYQSQISSQSLTSTSSSSAITPVQSDNSTQEAESGSNTTKIAGIVGGIACFLLFFGLIFYVFCRRRSQNRQFRGMESEDFVPFSDTASSTSFPPIYATPRSTETPIPTDNLAGRGAGPGSEREDEKMELELEHVGYTAPPPTDRRESTDMSSQPILDPAILGRSAPKLPEIRPGTSSTWRSSFGALMNWMNVPPSPLPGPSAFRLGKRGSMSIRGEREGSETLTSVGGGLSREGTIRTDRSVGEREKSTLPPSYRVSSTTFANYNLPIPGNTLIIANPTNTTTTRTLFPRRKSDATIKTARSIRSVATFGAVNLTIPPSPTTHLQTISPFIPSDVQPEGIQSPIGSEDSFGDILDNSELAYAQPMTAIAGPSSFHSPMSVSGITYPQPIALGNQGGEGIVSRVSIAKYERPRTLMFTRNSMAGGGHGSVFGASTSSVNTVGAASATESGGESGHTLGSGREGLGESGKRISGRWAEWRRSLVRSLGGDSDVVGHAM